MTQSPVWYREHGRRARSARRDVGRYLVLPAAVLALYRGTQMWFGYPTSQGDNALNDPFIMQLFLYSIIPLTLGATLVLPAIAARALIRLGPVVALLLVFLLGSVLTSVDPMQSVRGLVAVFVLTVPMLYLRAYYGAATAFDVARRVTAVLLVVNLLYTLEFSRYAFMSGSLNNALRGMFLHKNGFGSYCAVAFVLIAPTEFRYVRWATASRLLLCVLAAAGAVLSLSSTAVMLLVVGAGLLVLTAGLAQIADRGFRGLMFVALLLVTILLAGGAGQLLLQTIAGEFGKDLTLSGRSEIWGALWPVALDKPWLGHGFAMFRQTSYIQQFVYMIAWGPRSTHNTYLEILLNSGFPALLTWLAIVVAAIFRAVLLLDPARPDYHALRKGLTVIVIVLIASMTEAAQMLAPQALWPIMVLSLYCIAAADRSGQRSGCTG